MEDVITFEDKETGRTLEACFTFTCQVDPNYGADADGNRGIRSVWAEDIEILSVNEEDAEGDTHSWSGKELDKENPQLFDRLYDYICETANNLAADYDCMSEDD